MRKGCQATKDHMELFFILSKWGKRYANKNVVEDIFRIKSWSGQKIDWYSRHSTVIWLESSFQPTFVMLDTCLLIEQLQESK